MEEEIYRLKYLKYKRKYLEMQYGGNNIKYIIGREQTLGQINNKETIERLSGIKNDNIFIIPAINLKNKIIEINHIGKNKGKIIIHIKINDDKYYYKLNNDPSYKHIDDNFVRNLNSDKLLIKNILYDTQDSSPTKNDSVIMDNILKLFKQLYGGIDYAYIKGNVPIIGQNSCVDHCTIYHIQKVNPNEYEVPQKLRDPNELHDIHKASKMISQNSKFVNDLRRAQQNKLNRTSSTKQPQQNELNKTAPAKQPQQKQAQQNSPTKQAPQNKLKPT